MDTCRTKAYLKGAAHYHRMTPTQHYCSDSRLRRSRIPRPICLMSILQGLSCVYTDDTPISWVEMLYNRPCQWDDGDYYIR